MGKNQNMERTEPIPYMELERYGVIDFKEVDNRQYVMKRIGSWCYMAWFTLKECESSFAFFYGQLTKSFVVDWNVCQVEYNPNKTRMPSFIGAFLVKRYAKVMEIVSMDVAFDFKNVPVSSFLFDTHGASEVMTYGTLAGTPARYLRPKANDGRVKIYDKEAERKGKSDETEYKGVTRVEITYHNVSFLLRQNFYNTDLKRLEEMLSDLNSVKVPDIWKKVDTTGLNLGICKLLSIALEHEGAEVALQCVNDSVSKNNRKKYRDFINSKRAYKPIFDGDAITYGLALSDCLSSVMHV